METSLTGSAGVRSALLDHAHALLERIDGSLHVCIEHAVEGDAGQRRVVVTTAPELDVGGDVDTPAATALRLGRVSRVPTIERNTEFAEYCARCRRVGISSVASVPADLPSGQRMVLTVTSADHHGFDAGDLRQVRDSARIMADVLVGHDHDPGA